ncbi:hypothetical protein B9479_002496 [Cryptococcus floricola]|uniref:Uncharacterized protein n=1 Tax=Cryptococcus floricola TaxID=2591691 RepID=A0A5D3B3A8_9TREE|nr:hypothetical protein B9479_002496 [Cryptococcus floricola]
MGSAQSAPGPPPQSDHPTMETNPFLPPTADPLSHPVQEDGGQSTQWPLTLSTDTSLLTLKEAARNSSRRRNDTRLPSAGTSPHAPLSQRISKPRLPLADRIGKTKPVYFDREEGEISDEEDGQEFVERHEGNSLARRLDRLPAASSLSASGGTQPHASAAPSRSHAGVSLMERLERLSSPLKRTSQQQMSPLASPPPPSPPLPHIPSTPETEIFRPASPEFPPTPPMPATAEPATPPLPPISDWLPSTPPRPPTPMLDEGMEVNTPPLPSPPRVPDSRPPSPSDPPPLEEERPCTPPIPQRDEPFEMDDPVEVYRERLSRSPGAVTAGELMIHPLTPPIPPASSDMDLDIAPVDMPEQSQTMAEAVQQDEFLQISNEEEARVDAGKEESPDEEANSSAEQPPSSAAASDAIPEDTTDYMGLIRGLILDGVSPQQLIERGASAHSVMVVCQEIVERTKQSAGSVEQGSAEEAAFLAVEEEAPHAEGSESRPIYVDSSSAASSPALAHLVHPQPSSLGASQLKEALDLTIPAKSVERLVPQESFRPKQPSPAPAEILPPALSVPDVPPASSSKLDTSKPDASGNLPPRPSSLPPTVTSPNVPVSPASNQTSKKKKRDKKTKREKAAEKAANKRKEAPVTRRATGAVESMTPEDIALHYQNLHEHNLRFHAAMMAGQLPPRPGAYTDHSIDDYPVPSFNPDMPPHIHPYRPAALGPDIRPVEPPGAPPPPPDHPPPDVSAAALHARKRMALESMRRKKPASAQSEVEVDTVRPAVDSPQSQSQSREAEAYEQAAALEKEFFNAYISGQGPAGVPPDVPGNVHEKKNGSESMDMELEEPEEGEIAAPSPVLPVIAMSESVTPAEHIPGAPTAARRGTKRPHAEDLMDVRPHSAPPARRPTAPRRLFGLPLHPTRLLFHVDDDSDSDSDDEMEELQKMEEERQREADEKQKRLNENILRLKAEIAMKKRRKLAGGTSGAASPTTGNATPTLGAGVVQNLTETEQASKKRVGIDKLASAGAAALSVPEDTRARSSTPADIKQLTVELAQVEAQKEEQAKEIMSANALKSAEEPIIADDDIQVDGEDNHLSVVVGQAKDATQPSQPSTQPATSHKSKNFQAYHPILTHYPQLPSAISLQPSPHTPATDPFAQINRVLLDSIILTNHSQAGSVTLCRAEAGGGKCADRSYDDVVEYVYEAYIIPQGKASGRERQEVADIVAAARRQVVSGQAITTHTIRTDDDTHKQLFEKVGQLLQS